MIAMMAAANKPAELRVHLKGALKNGCTPEEIREVLSHVRCLGNTRLSGTGRSRVDDRAPKLRSPR